MKITEDLSGAVSVEINVDLTKVKKIFKEIKKYFGYENVTHTIESGVGICGYGYSMSYLISSNDTEDDKYDVKLNVDDNKNIIYNDSFYHLFKSRFFDFIENTGYDLNDDTFLVMCILHEFGHIDWSMMSKKNNILDLMKYVKDITEDLAYTVLSDRMIYNIRKQGYDLPYMIRGDEMYCDNFAMKHFIPVMKKLVGKGIVRNV